MRLLFTCLMALNLFISKADVNPLYNIKSKTWDENLSKDSLYIEGKVSYTSPPGPESFGKISSLDLKISKVFSRKGNYKIVIPRSAKGIFFFQAGYQEVIINLKEYTHFNQFKINITAKENRAVIMVEKPVVYLYSDAPITTTINLKPKGELSFTYPKYNTGWKIQTQKDGNIINLITQKTHPYLFWEANQKSMNFTMKEGIIEGYVIKTDTVLSFLEAQLTSMGLNSRESTDFITYWAPRLQTKNYAVIQFLVNEAYDDFFGDISSTTPIDYQLRVGMIFEVVDKLPAQSVVAPDIKQVRERNGFSLIEWGGAALQNTIISS